MAYRPKHQAQLEGGTPVPGATQGSRDCGPRTVQMGVDFLTKGDRVPTIPEIRKRMGTPGPQVTNVYDAQRCVESYDSIRGRLPLRYGVKTLIADVKVAVAAGKYVQVAIDYGKFNDVMLATGDPGYRDGHSVGILGERRYGGRVQWLLWDPLDDHRRPGIPQGPRWVPREKVLVSAEVFARARGRCFAGVFGGGQLRSSRRRRWS